MRPLRLELEGFTVYKKKQQIDFSNLSFFVIQGKTGAGKTSIVDAITFALYGKVPRYGKERGVESLVLSRGSSRLRVSLEFSVRGERFKIERFFSERPRQDIVRVEKNGRRLNLKKNEVEKWIREETGIDYGTFTKVILLPQGEFDRFLKPERPEDRRKILIGLLNLEIFEKIRRLASEEFKRIEGQLEAFKNRLESLEEVSEERINLLEKELIGLEEKLKRKKSEEEKARSLLEKAQEREKLLSELKEIQDRLKELEGKRKEIEKLKEKIEKAKSLQPYLPYMERLEDLDTQLRELSRALERETKEKIHIEEELKEAKEALSDLEEKRASLEVERKKLIEISAKRERLKTAWEELRRLEGLKELVNRKERELHDYENSARKIKEKLERLKEEISSLEEKLKDLEVDEEDYRRAILEAERAKDLKEKSLRLEELKDKVQSLERELRELDDKREEVSEKLEKKKEELEKVKVHFYASKVAELLAEGDTCPVCGGTYEGMPSLAHTAADLRELEKELEKLEAESRDLERVIDLKRYQLESLRREIEPLEKEVQAQGHLLTDEPFRRLKELEDKLKRKKELEEKLKKLTQERQSLEEKSTDLTRSADLLRKDIQNATALMEEVEERVRRLVDSVPTLQVLEVERKKLEEEEKRIETLIRETEESYERVRGYVEELTRSLSAKEIKIRELEKVKSTAEGERREVYRKLVPLFEKFGELPVLREMALSQEEIEAMEEKVESFHREVESLSLRKEEITEKLKGFEGVPSLRDVETLVDALSREIEKILFEKGNLEGQLKQQQELLKEKRELSAKVKELEEKQRVYKRIKEDLQGNRLQDFVANQMLISVVERASAYFRDFTGVYEFFLDRSGEIMVLDHSQGVSRNVKSLSGGETFLASLSLALGVSDILSGEAPLESLFIDEGFGSLDDEMREKVSDILEVVKQKINRMIGIITHVPDIAERFHQRIVVKKHGDFSTVHVVT